MFCFQCEQTAGCKGCAGKVGVCGKKADTAEIQDKLTGALIGLARATEGNMHLIGKSTSTLVVEGLFATLTNVNFDNDALLKLLERAEEEKRRMDEVEQQLNEVFGENCEVFRAAMRIIDVHAKGVSKIRSARELQQRLGRNILICVGDGENDVPMLRGADYAYSPADAVVADRFENVCACAQGSVADVIYKKIPEILEKKLDNGV